MNYVKTFKNLDPRPIYFILLGQKGIIHEYYNPC